MGGAKIQPKRGRPGRTTVDRLQAIAWFNTVAHRLRDDSPFRLEKFFQPENIRVNVDGKRVTTRAWDKYRDGDRLPSDGCKKDGQPGPVVAAGKVIPDSLYIFRHPIWQVMRANKLSFEETVRMLGFFEPFVSRYYLDLETRDPVRQFEAFAKNVGLPIWIDREDDPHKSLDHLAVHLMILRMDNFKYLTANFEIIAENIAKTLGPLSVSPWLGSIHEEFYDWLEANVWGDIFSRYYLHGSQSISGWRKSRHEWLVPSHNGEV